MRVTVLYDFSSEVDSELSIVAGEIITVTDQNVGNGWWEGVNAQGKKGVFPESYVEELVEGPSVYENVVASSIDSWGHPSDFDSDDGEDGPSTTSITDYRNPMSPQLDDAQSVSSGNKKKGFFFKSSDYIMGGAAPSIQQNDQVYILMNDEGTYFWKSPDSIYTVSLGDPKVDSKLGGMKKFIAYEIQPSFSTKSVSRRYKNFDWLHERLASKFSLIPIPPLPDKQISGRYEEQFIEHRRAQLQQFVDWVCRHPVLSQSEVWMHFITCRDEKKWKTGKRTAEKDPLVGQIFCAALRVTPEKALLPTFVDNQIESCKNFCISMDGALKVLAQAVLEQVTKYTNLYRRDYKKLGDCFSELAKALDIDERRISTGYSLSQSVGNTAGIMISIGKLYEEQAKRDWQPFCDKLHIYRGILSGYPFIYSEHKNVQQKRKECERLVSDQKMTNGQLLEVNRRVDVITISVLAEQSHFRQQRDTHLKEAMKILLAEQIDFYTRIISKLQQAKILFE